MGFNQQQVKNAALIYQTGKAMGMSNRDIQIGLMAAMVESNLINVHYGDRDSLGLFQQRASWGSESQRMDPTYAARKFFSSLRGLGDRRMSMSMGAAAQAVQRSAYPDRYGARIGDVRALFPRIATVAGDNPTDLSGNPYGAADPVTGGAKQNQPLIPEQTSIPTPGDMLGAWDTESHNLGQDMVAATDDPNSRPIPEISPATNQTVIQPMAETSGPYTKGVDGWRKAVVQDAMRYLGTPYVWGGSSPSGFDCSGLIQYVYGKAGKSMPRISYQQANSGHRVSIKDLRPGDLVAWDNSPRNPGADHIAIYIGGGRIIEAPKPGTSVRVRSLGRNEGAWGVSLG